MITVICLILTIIGGLNWFLVGAFDFNLVSWIFSGDLYWIARVVYVLVGVASAWMIWFLVCNFKLILHRDLPKDMQSDDSQKHE